MGFTFSITNVREQGGLFACGATPLSSQNACGALGHPGAIFSSATVEKVRYAALLSCWKGRSSAYIPLVITHTQFTVAFLCCAPELSIMSITFPVQQSIVF